MSKLIKAYYGNKMLFKKHCPNCKDIALIVDDRFTCCDRPAHLFDEIDFKQKRESMVPGIRTDVPVKIRRKILRFQNNQCVYCGIGLGRKNTKIHLDHFMPFCTGENGNDNYVAACSKCNGIKSAMLFNSIEEARVYIWHRREQKGLPNFDYFGGTYLVSKI